MKIFPPKIVLVFAFFFPFFTQAQSWYAHEFGIDLLPAFQIGEDFGQATYSVELIYRRPIRFGNTAFRAKLAFDNREPLFPNSQVFRNGTLYIGADEQIRFSNSYNQKLNMAMLIGLETTWKSWGDLKFIAAADLMVKKINARLNADYEVLEMQFGSWLRSYEHTSIPVNDEEVGIILSLGIEYTFLNHWNIRLELGPQFTSYFYELPSVDANGDFSVNRGVQENVRLNLINDIAITYRF